MVEDKVYIKRALVSCYDKSGLPALVELLKKSPDIEVLSSGGTAKSLQDLGIPAIEVSDFTRYRESPDGLVKTLQPKIHGGLLLNRSNPEHEGYMILQGIVPIDLVVVNLYPFQDTAAKAGSTFEDCREKIDIGGPAMIRSGAKNYLRVASVVDWRDMQIRTTDSRHFEGAFQMDEKGIFTSLEDRIALAQKAFTHTAEFDAAVSVYLNSRTPKLIARGYTLE